LSVRCGGGGGGGAFVHCPIFLKKQHVLEASSVAVFRQRRI
jgi:hypothetical protein